MKYFFFIFIAVFSLGACSPQIRLSTDKNSVFYHLLVTSSNGVSTYRHEDSTHYKTATEFIPYIQSEAGKVRLMMSIQYAGDKKLEAFQYIFQADDEQYIYKIELGDTTIEADLMCKEWIDREVPEDAYPLLKKAAVAGKLKIMYRGKFYVYPHELTAKEIQVLRDVISAYDKIKQGS